MKQWFILFFSAFLLFGGTLQAQSELDQLRAEIEALKQRDAENARKIEGLTREIEVLKGKEPAPGEDLAFPAPFPGMAPEPGAAAPSAGAPSSQFLIEDVLAEEEEEESVFYIEKAAAPTRGVIEEETEKLTGGALVVSGFFSLEYADYQMGDSTLGRRFSGASIIEGDSTFNNSHVHLYVDAQFLENFRFFAEFRFVYSPSTEFLAESNRLGRSGEVVIERAWVDWNFRPWLQMRAGHFLVPYGIWNLEHGAPILLSTRTPLLIRWQIFPERTTGIQFLGTFEFDNFELLYYAWFGNGKGSRLGSADDQDPNNNKAFGGRLELKFFETGPFQELAFGVSGYMGTVEGPEFASLGPAGRYGQLFAAVMNLAENNKKEYASLIGQGYNAIGEPMSKYEDQVVGIDFRFRLYGLLVQVEAVWNYVDARRTQNFREEGCYVQAGYEFNLQEWGMLTPFFRYDLVDANNRFERELGSNTLYTIGLNWRPYSSVIFKVEHFWSYFDDAHYRDFRGVLSSLSVSF